MRLAQLAESRTDVYRIKRSLLVIVPEFNARFDMGTPEQWAAHVQSIKENGVTDPLTGFKNSDDKFVVTAGHRRTQGAEEAVKLLKAELAACNGDKALRAEIKRKLDQLETVPVMSEPVGYTDKDRHFDTLTSNSGLPLNMLEQALHFQRLMKDFQVSEDEIRRRTGTSITYLQNCALLVSAPELHPFIKKGRISPSLVVEIIRKIKDPVQRKETVESALKTAETAGKTNVTAKHLNESVRSQVAPPKASKKNNAPPEPEGKRFNALTSDDKEETGGGKPSTPASRKSFEDGLGNSKSMSLSTHFDPKDKIEALITTAASKNNGSFFYNVSITIGDPTGKAKTATHDSGWRYSFVSSYTAPHSENARGFDNRNSAILGGWKEAADFAGTLLAGATSAHRNKLLGIFAAEIKKLSPAEETTDAPETDTNTGNATIDDDECPTHDADAVDNIRRIQADLSQVGGVKTHNDRYATLTFLVDYVNGKHTHNNLRAFILYGSAETRDSAAKKQKAGKRK